MDRPSEIKMDKVWSLCKNCWSFNERERPSFTAIRERLEKILDRTPRRLPRFDAPEYSTPSASEASNSGDTGYAGDTTSGDTTGVYYGYFRPVARIGPYDNVYDNEHPYIY